MYFFIIFEYQNNHKKYQIMKRFNETKALEYSYKMYDNGATYKECVIGLYNDVFTMKSSKLLDDFVQNKLTWIYSNAIDTRKYLPIF